MEIVRKFLSAENLAPPNIRYDPDGDAVQTLVDGTWVDTPEADPRTATSGFLPPVSGSAVRCDSAANMVAAIKNIVDTALTATGVYELASLLLAVLTAAFPLLAIFDPLIWALAELIIGIGSAGLAAAFTSTVYDDLLCYFYCAVGEDGSITQSGLDQIRTQIGDNQGGTVVVVTEAIFAITGFVGVQRWGAQGSETGDCDACGDCGWSLSVDLTWAFGAGSFMPQPGCSNPNFTYYGNQAVLGTYSGNPAWQSEKGYGDSANRFGYSWPVSIPAGCELTEIQMWMVRTSGNLDNFERVNYPLGYTRFAYDGAFQPADLPWTGSIVANFTHYVGLGTCVGGDGGFVYVTEIRLSGTGVRPSIPEVAPIH